MIRTGSLSDRHLLALRIYERAHLTGSFVLRSGATSSEYFDKYFDRARAQELFGAEVAAAVPDDGLVDVHRYRTVVLNGQRAQIDATFPGAAWDGHSPLPLACGPGKDYPAGDEPDAGKRALEEENCDPAVREPFIAALTTFS